jgi:hypothetical protein
MTATFEMLGKFDSEADCQKLLYAPPPQPLKYRETQFYRIDFEGDAGALNDFVRRVLFDPISQEIHSDGVPCFSRASFILEYGMKGGALDLEKETILERYKTLEKPAFHLARLALRKRIYVFGEKAEPKAFIRDVCNPAIHSWEMLRAAA